VLIWWLVPFARHRPVPQRDNSQAVFLAQRKAGSKGNGSFTLRAHLPYFKTQTAARRESKDLSLLRAKVVQLQSAIAIKTAWHRRARQSRGREVNNLPCTAKANDKQHAQPYRCKTNTDVYRVSQNVFHKRLPVIPHPLLSKKSSYQHGSKSEHVPRYPVLCRNPRNAMINKKHVLWIMLNVRKGMQ